MRPDKYTFLIHFWSEESMFIPFMFIIFFNSSLQMDSRVEFPRGKNKKKPMLDSINPDFHFRESRDLLTPE